MLSLYIVADLFMDRVVEVSLCLFYLENDRALTKTFVQAEYTQTYMTVAAALVRIMAICVRCTNEHIHKHLRLGDSNQRYLSKKRKWKILMFLLGN